MYNSSPRRIRERERGQEVTFEERIAKNCPKMMKDRKPQVEEES